MQAEQLGEPHQLQQADHRSRHERLCRPGKDDGAEPEEPAQDLLEGQHSHQVQQEAHARQVVVLHELQVVDEDETSMSLPLIVRCVHGEDHVGQEYDIDHHVDRCPGDAVVRAGSVCDGDAGQAGGAEGNDDSDVDHRKPHEEVPPLEKVRLPPVHVLPPPWRLRIEPGLVLPQEAQVEPLLPLLRASLLPLLQLSRHERSDLRHLRVCQRALHVPAFHIQQSVVPASPQFRLEQEGRTSIRHVLHPGQRVCTSCPHVPS
eukprot:751430-Hanusia_phi.AAC.2